MRNLVEYPVTVQEVIDFLVELKATMDEEQVIGDMGPLLLKAAARIIVESPKDICEQVLREEINPIV